MNRSLADIKVEILDLVPLLEKGQILVRLLGPPGRGIGKEFLIELLVFLPALDVGDLAHPLLYRIDLLQLHLRLFCHCDLPFFVWLF
jgi:hypothetical protein